MLSKERPRFMAGLAAWLFVIPAAMGFTATACEADNPPPANSQEASDPTQGSGEIEPTSHISLDQLVKDYLEAVEGNDPFRQSQLFLEFPVLTSEGRKTLGECLGQAGKLDQLELEMPEPDSLIIRALVNVAGTKTELKWPFENPAGVWKLPEANVPQCPINLPKG